MSPDRYVKNGKVAVIYSPGFGAGWMTWNGDLGVSREELLFDPGLAEMIDRGDPKEHWEEYAEGKWGDVLYFGGLSQAHLGWLDSGTEFVVWEYDGAESIILASELVVTA